jgi:hypothetical protein
MAQKLHGIPGDWTSYLGQKLAGDLTAATVSATLVAPTVTIIDRCVASKTKPKQRADEIGRLLRMLYLIGLSAIYCDRIR